MAVFDLDERRTNSPGMPRRTTSGFMPAPRATPEQWARVRAKAEELVALLRDIENATGDPEIRALGAGLEDATELAQDRAFPALALDR